MGEIGQQKKWTIPDSITNEVLRSVTEHELATEKSTLGGCISPNAKLLKQNIDLIEEKAAP